MRCLFPNLAECGDINAEIVKSIVVFGEKSSDSVLLDNQNSFRILLYFQDGPFKEDLLELLRADLSILQHLKQKHNKFNSIPFCLKGRYTNQHFNNIHVLDLSYLGIKVLPEEIGLFTSLKQLNLSHNNVERFPCSIGLLQKLTILVASHNQLVVLPQSICNLSELSTLELEYNSLEVLPAEICALENLTRVTLSHNPLLAKSLIQEGRCNNVSCRRESLLDYSMRGAKDGEILKKKFGIIPYSIRSLLIDESTCYFCRRSIFTNRFSLIQWVYRFDREIPIIHILCSLHDWKNEFEAIRCIFTTYG